LQFITLDLSLQGLESLNILRAIEEMINGEVYFLATVIIVVSLVWPYVRTLGMLSLFCIPEKCISPQRRGTLLVWLDWLAKWSMFDIYTLIVFLLAMNLNITSPKRLSILPEGLYHVELILSPQMGLYSNLLAQIVSQLVSHVQIYYHRKIVEEKMSGEQGKAKEVQEQADAVQPAVLLGRLKSREAGKPKTPRSSEAAKGDVDLESPSQTVHSDSITLDIYDRAELPVPRTNIVDIVDIESPSRDDAGDDAHPTDSTESVCSHTCALLRIRQHSCPLACLVRIVVPAMLLVGVLLLGVGMVLPALSVTTSGMVGILLDFGEADGRTVTHSVLDMTQVLAGQMKSNAVNGIGIWSLTVIFLLCTFVTPVIQAAVWAVMWAVPLSPARLKGLINLSEIVSAWNFFEVFMISIVIAVMQLERLAFGLLETMRSELGDGQYTMINQFVQGLRDIGLVSSADASIFELAPDLHSGAYVLLVAAALLACAGLFINGQSAAYAKSREL
jgi:hypothetical protein